MKKTKSEYKTQLLKELQFDEKQMQENIGYIIHLIDYWGLYQEYDLLLLCEILVKENMMDYVNGLVERKCSLDPDETKDF